MFKGFVLGNSPVSVTCLHEMEYFPKLQGLYAPQAGADEFSVHDAIGREIEFFASRGVGSDGLPYPRWDIRGFEACNPYGGSGNVASRLPAQPQRPTQALRDSGSHKVPGTRVVAFPGGGPIKIPGTRNVAFSGVPVVS